MTTVTLKVNEPIDVALRRFRRDIENRADSGVAQSHGL